MIHTRVIATYDPPVLRIPMRGPARWCGESPRSYWCIFTATSLHNRMLQLKWLSSHRYVFTCMGTSRYFWTSLSCNPWGVFRNSTQTEFSLLQWVPFSTYKSLWLCWIWAWSVYLYMLWINQLSCTWAIIHMLLQSYETMEYTLYREEEITEDYRRTISLRRWILLPRAVGHWDAAYLGIIYSYWDCDYNDSPPFLYAMQVHTHVK